MSSRSETQESVKPAPAPRDTGAKSSTDATRESVTEAAKKPVTVAVPGTGLVDPTRDASGQVIWPDQDELPEPVVLASGMVTEGPPGDANIGGLRNEDPDLKLTPEQRVEKALKEAGMEKPAEAPPLDARAYKAQEAARVRLAAAAAQLDYTRPGGYFLVGGIPVDCNGRKIED